MRDRRHVHGHGYAIVDAVPMTGGTCLGGAIGSLAMAFPLAMRVTTIPTIRCIMIKLRRLRPNVWHHWAAASEL